MDQNGRLKSRRKDISQTREQHAIVEASAREQQKVHTFSGEGDAEDQQERGWKVGRVWMVEISLGQVEFGPDLEWNED